MKVRIHRLASKDYRAVRKIERIIVNEYLQLLKETGGEDTIEPWITPQYFNHYVKTKTSYVAEVDDKAVGFIFTQPTVYIHNAKREIWLEYIAVLPEIRKKGIGSRLISKVIGYANSQGFGLLYTTLNPNNNESIRLLMKHGFEIKDWKEANKKLKERVA